MTAAEDRDNPLRRSARVLRRKAHRAGFAVASRAVLARPFRLLVVAGQKRSGNHVFLNWLLSQSPGPCAFWNHVAPDQYPTERHRREFRLNDPRQQPTVIFSYEDRALPDIFAGRLTDFLTRHEAQITDRHLCLVLRDPRNLMASRFRKWPEEHTEADRADAVTALWHAYAEAARAPDAVAPDWGGTAVWFNAFVTDTAYRRTLSDRLGIRPGDRGLDEVTDHGHGSSFGGTAAAPGQGVFDRWRAYEDDPAFARLFADGSLDTAADAAARALTEGHAP